MKTQRGARRHLTLLVPVMLLGGSGFASGGYEIADGKGSLLTSDVSISSAGFGLADAPLSQEQSPIWPQIPARQTAAPEPEVLMAGGGSDGGGGDRNLEKKEKPKKKPKKEPKKEKDKPKEDEKDKKQKDEWEKFWDDMKDGLKKDTPGSK